MEKSKFEDWKRELEELCKEASDYNKLSKEYLFRLNYLASEGILLLEDKNTISDIIPTKYKENKKQIKTKEQKIITSNLEDYIVLSETEQHPRLIVAKQTILQRKNWYQAHEELQKQNSRMLNLREFADFLLLLKLGNAEDGLGNKIAKSDLQSIYLDITEVRDTYRAEWLDAKFEEKNGILGVHYNHRTKGKNLIPQNSEPLETCMMKNCKVELGSFNKQGIPTKEGTDFNYWYPTNSSVALFYANADGADLYCDGDPLLSNGGLGVRAAKIFTGKK